MSCEMACNPGTGNVMTIQDWRSCRFDDMRYQLDNAQYSGENAQQKVRIRCGANVKIQLHQRHWLRLIVNLKWHGLQSYVCFAGVAIWQSDDLATVCNFMKITISAKH